MFNLEICAVPGCKQHVSKSSRLCEEHLNTDYQGKIVSYIQENSLISGLVAPGMDFKGLDLKNKHFVDCYFHHTSWEECCFDGSRFQMVFFDDSRFTNTSMRKVNMLHCVFTESVLKESSWKGSDLVSINWNRIKCRHCDFSESDLYYSRFIAASLKDINFIDCNLKRVDFCLARLKRVSMRYSNVEEAYFQTENRE